MKKNIWYITKYAIPYKYGWSTRQFSLSEEWMKKGHNVTVICSNSNHLTNNLPSFKGKKYEETINGIQTVWLNTYRYSTAQSFGRIISWIHFEWQLLTLPKKKYAVPDIIIVSSLSILTIINGYILKKRYMAKLIFEIRDIWPLTLIDLGGYSNTNFFIKSLAWIERFGYEHADIIVGTMPNLKEHVDNVLKSNKAVHCIPQGVNPYISERYQEGLSSVKFNQYIPTDKFIIGYAGSMGKANALDVFLQSARILNERKDIHFMLLGDGDKKDELKKYASDLGNVTFIQKVNSDEVQAFLGLCDVLYAGTRDSRVYKYGISLNKLIDYMWAGKPVILSYNGVADLIEESQCGSVIEAENPQKLAGEIISFRYMNKRVLHRMGLNGRNYILKNRNFTVLANRYVELFSL
jgi:glycosyltransferase involved in cell wall biosynthesis